ncbi:hypothetical protein ACM64Y_18925 [Novispirillum sp. DQ9]|uniref:hypothetical protein n=1 Tax=Novispirillum sp. DQ9 TaxID=3398612 RepID=UPI003C7A6544
MSKRKPSRLELAALRFWHAALAGGYGVAYVTGDEDTYAMHLFSGYVVLGVVVLRLLAGLLAPEGSPLRLPRPSLAALKAWLGGAKGMRNPLFAWIGAAVLAAVGVAAASGALADVVLALEDPHEAVAEASLWVIAGHVAFIFFIFGGRRLLARLRDGLRPMIFKETAR